MTGSWEVNVSVGSMPEKIATAVSNLNEVLVGAEYTPIAYLGSQVVNGTNHAVLARQVILTGRDTENIVVLIFNEKPGAMEVTLVNIERVVEGGLPMGGVKIHEGSDIPEDAKLIWDVAFEGFVGSKVTPFALLGTQIVKGVNYIFAATVTPVVPDAATRVAMVTVNSASKEVTFSDMIENKYDAALGYSFTWLKNGSPLGEWP